MPGGNVKHRIIGDSVQTVAIELNAGEGVFSRLGTLLFVKGAVKSESNPDGPYWAVLSQTLTPSGETPLVLYKCETGGGLIGFSAPGPGKVHHVSLDGNMRMIVRRTSIIAASVGTNFEKLFLEGEDTDEVPKDLFVTLSGSGQAWLHGPGNLVDFTLGPDERVVVDGNMILGFHGDINPSPKPLGKPGQDGPLPYILFMHVTGPGRLILHTMSHD